MANTVSALTLYIIDFLLITLKPIEQNFLALASM